MKRAQLTQSDADSAREAFRKFLGDQLFIEQLVGEPASNRPSVFAETVRAQCPPAQPIFQPDQPRSLDTRRVQRGVLSLLSVLPLMFLATMIPL